MINYLLNKIINEDVKEIPFSNLFWLLLFYPMVWIACCISGKLKQKDVLNLNNFNESLKYMIGLSAILFIISSLISLILLLILGLPLLLFPIFNLLEIYLFGIILKQIDFNDI